MSSPTPPKKAAPKAKPPLQVKIPLRGGTVVLQIVEGEDVIGVFDHREAKDFGLAVRDAVHVTKRAEARG